MSLIDFGIVQKELKDAGIFHTHQVLVRKNKHLAIGNVPSVFIITDTCIYHGGTEHTNNNFYCIRLSKLLEVSEVGKSMWKSIKIRYAQDDRIESIYVCPFTGDPGKPVIDEESFKIIMDLLKANLNSV